MKQKKNMEQKSAVLVVAALLAATLSLVPGVEAQEDDGDCSLAGGAVLACRVESNGNWVSLVETSRGIECQWSASTPYDPTFSAAHYFAWCEVTPDGSIPIADGSENGASSGAIVMFEGAHLGNDVSWSMKVIAAEFTTESKTNSSQSVYTVDEWHASKDVGAVSGVKCSLKDGDCDGGLHAEFDYHEERTTSSASTYDEDTTTYYKERQEMRAGVENMHVGAVEDADFVEVGWSGKTWGCDAPNIVEAFLGPREIDGYNVSVDAKASTGTLTIDLGNSRFAGVTDQGDFEEVQPTPNGAEASWGEDSGFLGLLSLQTLDEGQGFSSELGFNVDYEVPEGVGASGILKNIGHPLALLETIGQSSVLQSSVPVGSGQVQWTAPSMGGYRATCDNAVESVEQAWSATATGDTVRGELSATSGLGVEVLWDLYFAGQQDA